MELKDKWSPRPILGTAPLVNDGAFVCEIYCSGCKFNCPDCQNAELQPYENPLTELMTVDTLYNKVLPYLKNPLVKELHILGGSPLYSENRAVFLSTFLSIVKENYPDILVLLFTGYNRKELPNYAWQVIKYCDYVKCGRYIKELPNYNVTPTFELASNNQKVYKVVKDDNQIILKEVKNG